MTRLSAETASTRAAATVGANAPITLGEETGSRKKTLEMPVKLRTRSQLILASLIVDATEK